MSLDPRREVVRVLRDLIRIDTSNPPGRETDAALYLRSVLEPSGVECELVARDSARANLVARLRGGGDGPSLAFLGHLDVVPADRAEWSVDPFAGVEREGAIWGRGAVDMKCQVAAVAVALKTLAEEGFRPGGDVLLVAVADEEVGDAEVGMPWLVEERADLAPDFVVGEGAGERLPHPDGPIYVLDHGVKQSVQATLRVRGHGGDASLPGVGQNALLHLSRLLERLGGRDPRLHLPDEVAPLLEAAAPGDGALPERLERARRTHPALGRLLEGLLTNVMIPTRAESAGSANVVPAEATATIYAAPLPGATAADLERELREALGEDGYALEVPDPHGGSTSPLETPLHHAIAGFLERHDPEARLVPALGYGFSDCHWARESWGSVAYGFVPFRHADPLVNQRTKHGPDERVLVGDLAFQLEAALHLARTVARP